MDGTIAVYLKNKPENEKIINDYKITPENALLKVFPQADNYLDFLYLSRFFQIAGWQELAEISQQKFLILTN